ncbi:12599_t:CDS:1 [Funneliformis caledonium]|uniref:12599_t:CDS:1 n=1 Tax=Funneliformis caledonium TaxID=1117310 RepID=A0A9N8YQW0_9GLOM|nr:12599_t:CDS:1 [Funneliformis caledonium]
MVNKLDPTFRPPYFGCGYQVVGISSIKPYNYSTSHAKSGYIGITCHWLTKKMELFDILVYAEQIIYQMIMLRQNIRAKPKLLGLESKVKSAITDNSNTVKAIKEL